MVSTPLVDRIRNWMVHDTDYLTDHKLITFDLSFDKTPPSLFRNFKMANWSYFKCLLSNKIWENPPKFWFKKTIELEADKLIKDITQALDKVCPEKEQIIKTKPPSWWTTEL